MTTLCLETMRIILPIRIRVLLGQIRRRLENGAVIQTVRISRMVRRPVSVLLPAITAISTHCQVPAGLMPKVWLAILVIPWCRFTASSSNPLCMQMLELARSLIGPKATIPIIVLILLIAPIAVWHYVHVIVYVVRALFQNEEPEK